MSEITIRFTSGTTNVKEETIGEHTYLTLSNPLPGQIAMTRGPAMQALPPPVLLPQPQPVRTTVSTTRVVSAGPVGYRAPALTYSPMVSSPTRIVSAVPTVVSAPRTVPSFVQTPRAVPIPALSPLTDGVEYYGDYHNGVSFGNPTCIGAENTLMVKINNHHNVDDIVKTVEEYVDVKCTEVRTNFGNKLLVIHFVDRAAVNDAYEALIQNYGTKNGIEVFK